MKFVLGYFIGIIMGWGVHTLLVPVKVQVEVVKPNQVNVEWVCKHSLLPLKECLGLLK